MVFLFFSFSLCVLDNPNAPESGESCFQALTLANGSAKYQVSAGEFTVNNRVALPAGLRCSRCVLRWQYRAGTYSYTYLCYCNARLLYHNSSFGGVPCNRVRINKPIRTVAYIFT